MNDKRTGISPLCRQTMDKRSRAGSYGQYCSLINCQLHGSVI
uniref:Uncharacterized protein n=1 Tax=Anguilla anguilla TaxID=7936 RepID=A0A0E9PJS9_ANGAN